MEAVMKRKNNFLKIISGFLITLIIVNMLSVYPVLADIPTHSNPVLVSSGGNDTIYEDITCSNVSTADGDGDFGINATVSIAKDDKIKEIFRTDKQHIGKMWRYVTLILGMKPQQHEYKVMGMAPYADQNIVNYVYNIYKEHLVVDGLDFKYKTKPKDLYFYFKDKFDGIRFDGIAGGVQKWTEEILTQWFRNIIKETGIDYIVFSGGLSMNG